MESGVPDGKITIDGDTARFDLIAWPPTASDHGGLNSPCRRALFRSGGANLEHYRESNALNLFIRCHERG